MSHCVREQTLYFLLFGHNSGWTEQLPLPGFFLTNTSPTRMPILCIYDTFLSHCLPILLQKKILSICVDSKVICDPNPDDLIKEEFHLKSTQNKTPGSAAHLTLWLRGIPLIPPFHRHSAVCFGCVSLTEHSRSHTHSPTML